MDTGTIDHIICSISFFTTIASFISKLVKLPIGNFASVTHVGTVKVFVTLTLTVFFVYHLFHST
jgi:hypothetical protein